MPAMPRPVSGASRTTWDLHDGRLRRAATGIAAVAVTVLAAFTAPFPAAATAAAPEQPATADRLAASQPGDTTAGVDTIVDRMLALPYQSAYAPQGTDAAFGGDDYPAAFPLTDTATGTCCAGPVPDQPPIDDLAPPFAAFPDSFDLIRLRSADGTPLHAFVSVTDGAPGVVVAHGFNTNGKYSVVRQAANLAANGFSVIVPDHRDMGREWARGGSYHPDGTRHGQSLGWKESQDFLAAAAELDRRGVEEIGMLGLSEGAQNTVLALSKDRDDLIDAALTFSAPADQATLAQRNEETTAALLTTVVNNPDICGYLGQVGQREEFSATPNFMLRHDSAVGALDGDIGDGVDTPAVHFYAADDELVPDWNATILASRTLDIPSQRTVLIEAGNHAYFYDRWWTQKATLAWFRFWLDRPGDHTTGHATVAQSPGGTPLSEQTIDLSGTTREEGNAELRDRTFCPASDEPVGPNALLDVDGTGETWRADGRNSYSGWDQHTLRRWSLDFGDGAPAVTGTDIRNAAARHTYDERGAYELTLTVTDDTGRTATETETVTVPAIEVRDTLTVCPPPDQAIQDGFGDDDGSIHEAAINCLAQYAIVAGFDDGDYRPARRVSRAQLATYVTELIQTATGEALSVEGDAFDDDEGSVHETSIDKLAAAGVVRGTTDGRYRPTGDVSRAQMATFVANALDYVDDERINASAPTTDRDFFTDDTGDTHEDAINRLAAVGVVTGRDHGGYQPAELVDRGPMAAFVVRAADALAADAGWFPTGVD